MAEAVHKTGHQVIIDKYAQKTALRLGVAPESMRAEFRKTPAKASASREPAEASAPAPPEAMPRPNAQEFWLLKLALLDDDVLDWIAAHLDADWIQHAQVREILSARLALHHQQPEASVTMLLDQFEARAVRSLISEALSENRPIPNPMQQLQDLAFRLRNQSFDQQLNKLIQRSSRPETGEAERLQLLRQQQELRAAKRQPLAPRGQPGAA
jgi:hypothetical protein